MKAKLGAALCVGAAATMVALGASRFAADAAFFNDESTVALAIRDRTPTELFAPLGAYFPRYYLAAIQQLSRAFGYRTDVLRALPMAFFVAATCAWIWLLYRRFRDEPGVLGLALLLCFVPTTWLVSGTMLKQYSFDTSCALLPFLLGDRFFARAIGHRGRPWKLLALCLPCALSYTYVFALAGRVAGWMTVALQERRALDPRAFAWLLAGLVGSLASLWLTDARHTYGLPVLGEFWGHCIPGGSVETWRLVDRFAFGWYDGRLGFLPHDRPPYATLLALKLFCAAGVVRVVVRRTPPGSRWGSRSRGCLAMVASLLVAAPILGYPICAGRLTLFAFFATQIVLLEGVSLAADRVGGLMPRSAAASLLVPAVLALSLAPAAFHNTRTAATTPPPGDLRALEQYFRDGRQLPVIVDPCSEDPVRALPEGLGAGPIVTLDDDGVLRAPASGDAWFVSIVHPNECDWFFRRLEAAADLQQITAWPAPRLYLARFGEPARGDGETE